MWLPRGMGPHASVVVAVEEARRQRVVEQEFGLRKLPGILLVKNIGESHAKKHSEFSWATEPKPTISQ